ncbi:UDP-glycosyltransferase UGT39B1 precursor [Bombyx mori]|uniref:UDP-glucuronosyltransferase n=1 Tax=Bombyx mori TaxID=7091 RepID=G9LPT8_BOMMO|nr:UDP-glycosyltransferase UGT39B1 precursor [Bombyx mori]AEW43161.1 UDP-glycosyltransferase UGT39B1 [Bombyx mori]
MFNSFIFLFVVVTGLCESANILYVMPFTSKSHHIMLKPIGLELARRGHNVTVITGFRDKNAPANYRQIQVDQKEIWDVIGTKRPNVFDMVGVSTEEFHNMILWRGGLGFTNLTLNSAEVKSFLAEDNKFDLVICEQFFQEAMNILAHKYKAPLVLVTTFGNCMRHNIMIRNPLQLATVISEFLEVRNPTSFFARLRNVYFTVYEYVWWRYWYLEEQEKLVKKYIPNLEEPVPTLLEMQKNASLILINGHFSFDTPAAYLPNIIEIGGVHLSKSDTKLPADLQNILDEAKHGVIYINFGSNVRSAELPLEKRNVFLNVIKKLKQTVVWKWEDDSLDKMDNLVVRKWLPQKEILSHPNIKVFISHGGLIGTQEAIFHGVPIIGVPIYADQYNNLLQAEEIGFGKILEFKDIREQNLDNYLRELLTNNTYRDKAKEMSIRFKDRPTTALDTAMYWIEYIIRHNGASFMKNPARKLHWIQYAMLDVYGFILAVVLTIFYTIYKLSSFILHKLKAPERLIRKKFD